MFSARRHRAIGVLAVCLCLTFANAVFTDGSDVKDNAPDDDTDDGADVEAWACDATVVVCASGAGSARVRPREDRLFRD